METPKPTDIEWSDYVLSKFHESELDKGYPKVDGLRRVIELVMGPVMESKIVSVDTRKEQNQFAATVVYSIKVKFNGSSEERTFQDVADAGNHNIKPPRGNESLDFRNYATTIAATRAEARVMRKALKLKVMAAEEAMELKTDLPMSSSQANVINLICNRKNLNAEEVFEQYMTKFGLSDKKQLTHQQAIKIINELNKE